MELNLTINESNLKIDSKTLTSLYINNLSSYTNVIVANHEAPLGDKENDDFRDFCDLGIFLFSAEEDHQEDDLVESIKIFKEGIKKNHSISYYKDNIDKIKIFKDSYKWIESIENAFNKMDVMNSMYQ